MEKIDVTAHFTPDGHVSPVSFTWQGKLYRVDSIGRRWKAKDGLHILVMTPGNRAYHLVFKDADNTWGLIRGAEIPTVPRV
jgi:hypothetical protein